MTVKPILIALLMAGIGCSPAIRPVSAPADGPPSPSVLHVKVHHEPGMFGGWPAYLSRDDGQTWEYLNDPVPDAGI